MYYIMGWDKDTDDTVCLHEAYPKSHAVDWAKKYCREDNMGNWDKIYVMYQNQVDVAWNGEPATEEVVIWSCYNEPMPWSDNAMEEF
jgi:hypothetical protein